MSRVLVIGGDRDVRGVLEGALQLGGHEVVSRASSLLGVMHLGRAVPRFDLLIVNSIYLQPLDLDTFLRAIGGLVEHRTPVILTTAAGREDVRDLLPKDGARICAVLPKPFNVRDLLGLVQRVLLTQRVEAARERLETDSASADEPPSVERVVRQHQHLRAEVAMGLLDVLDGRARGLRGHGIRVHDYAHRLGAVMGLDEPGLGATRFGALLHDVGKCVLPDRLLVNGRLEDPEDLCRLREHGAEGAGLLRGISLFDRSVEVIHHHHERYDGSGHPQGLRGDDIPVGARICAVANAFDNACEGRRGLAPRGMRLGLRTLREQAGSVLDPQLVAAFQQAMAGGNRGSGP